MISQPALFRQTLFSFLICALLITLCYIWVDPALAFWINDHNFRQFLVFEYYTYFANAIVWATALYYLYFAFSFASRKEEAALVPGVSVKWPFLNVANSVAIAIFMKDAFKFIFGRYWPKTWSNNNLSLIHDHAYGFHFFHSGVAFTSFPSGHTTITVTAVTALWITYPRGPIRWVALLGALAVIMGLLAENYHFLGDCIAGAWVGATVAIYVTAYTIRKSN